MANLQKIYSDLDFMFKPLPVTKDIALRYDDQAVIRSVINLLLTNFYERPFQPNLGCNIRRLLFENVDPIIATQIESACNDLLSKRGLYDFLVICDTSNNTPSTIANNQLYVDVAIEPMRDVEFIYIPIALYNPGTVAQLGASST